MKNVSNLEKYNAKGDLLYRIHKSQGRLESSPYTPDDCKAKDHPLYDWPGDWIGRALLGNVLISRASGSESVYEDELLNTVARLQNDKGYLGVIQPEGVVDEQQLSGHNWLLRGLLEYGDKFGKEDDQYSLARSIADDIVENLYLPVADYYKDYPISLEERVFEGEKSGTLTGSVINHWKTSSDTGCAFMCLDGLADYYTITRNNEVGAMLDKMIAKFITIDFTGIQMQTHASLSATRGIVKYYKATHRQDLLDFALKFAQLYIDYGMTANYANYNWFCRPTWTEPCAIIDSFMLFSDLYFITGDIKYLRIARRIYKNAICFGQRNNGGFGTDKCADVNQPILRPDGDLDKLNEAYWCCSMRGGEGLARVSQNNVAIDGKNIYFTAFSDGQYKGSDFKITYKYNEDVRSGYKIIVDSNGRFKNDLYVYLPEKAENVAVYIEFEEKDVAVKNGFVVIPAKVINEYEGYASIDILFRLNIEVEEAVGVFANKEKKGHVVMLGDTMLGLPADKTEGYEGIPEFEFNREFDIKDKKTSIIAEMPGKNINCEADGKLYGQAIRIVF